MDSDIRTALRSLEQTIKVAKGPVFTDADYGRALRAFLSVCNAMETQDRSFKVAAAKAERIEKERERERNRLSLWEELEEELRYPKDDTDD